MLKMMRILPALQTVHKKCFLLLVFSVAATVYFIYSFENASLSTTIENNRNNSTHSSNLAKVVNVEEVIHMDPILVDEEIKIRFPDAYYCYHKNSADLNVDILDDILLSKRQPTPDKSIFFVISTCFNGHLVEIRKRQACALEAIATHNPNRDIFVLFTSAVGYGHNGEQQFNGFDSMSDYIKLLSGFSNIFLRNANMSTFAAGTPMESLERSGKVYQSNVAAVHLSDVVRLIALYRYGGIYLDMDMIALRNFDTLPLNFFAQEFDGYLNNGALGISHTGFGHQLYEKVLRKGAADYVPDSWMVIGPALITAVVANECNMRTSTDSNSTCPELRIFPYTAFNPFAYFEEQRLWNRTHTDVELLQRVRDHKSFVAHLWTSRSTKYPLNIDDISVVNILAKENCPITYPSSYEFNYRK